jgi:hypothetical protein
LRLIGTGAKAGKVRSIIEMECRKPPPNIWARQTVRSTALK